MSETRSILVAVDDSDATKAALARVAAGHAADGATVRLFHVVGPVPPALLEFGGADTPAEEERMERLYEVAESEWFSKARHAALPLLEAARDTLVAAGIAAARISIHVAESLPEDRLAHLILDDAREAGCDVVVVGHTAYGWLTKHFHADVAHELQKHADGLEIVVVE
jgi:nucleotide-binding universal stress UspA family protein